MNKSIVTMTMLLSLGGFAFAQQVNTPAPKNSAASGVKTVVAPHRQPRAADIPTDQSIDKPSAEDRILDEKLKGICNKC